MKFLLAGLSVRALAQSAARAGYRVAGLDYFGDRDLPEAMERRSLSPGQRPYDAKALPGLAVGMDYDALVYASNLENRPAVVRALAGGRPVYGNGPEILKQARDWSLLQRFCAEEGLGMPLTLFAGEEGRAAPDLDWLRKPVLGGGGHAIRPWDGKALAPGFYLQARVAGVNASAAFVADGAKSVVLGLSEQIIGDFHLGARGFRHCGNVVPLAPELGGGPALLDQVQAMVDRLAARFRLRGVGGVDFMVVRDRDGRAQPILLEINPRPTSSAELFEESGLVSIFDAHVRAVDGTLPPRPPAAPAGEYLAKGVLFARRSTAIPDSPDWPGAMGRIGTELRDVGLPGQEISPGGPVCSILTRGPDRETALERLYASARTLELNLFSDKKES